jgi:hypothetical protein
MPATFRRMKQLVADFWADEKFYLSSVCRCDGFTPAEIKIVEGAAK